MNVKELINDQISCSALQIAREMSEYKDGKSLLEPNKASGSTITAEDTRKWCVLQGLKVSVHEVAGLVFGPIAVKRGLHTSTILSPHERICRTGMRLCTTACWSRTSRRWPPSCMIPPSAGHARTTTNCTAAPAASTRLLKTADRW